MAKKSWTEKLNQEKVPQRKTLEKDFADMKAGEMMYIATPQLMKSYVENIPFGKKISPKEIRKDMAAQNNCDVTCPVTTGIYLRIVAEAALIEMENGKELEDVSPFWRTIPADSALAKKLSCGTAFIQEQIDRENSN